MDDKQRIKIIRDYKYCRHHSQENCTRKQCCHYPKISCEWLLSKDIVSVLDADTRELNALRKFKQYFDGLYGHGLELSNWHLNGSLESFDNFYDSAMAEYESMFNNHIKE